MKEKEVKIAFHTRFGLRFLQILIIVLAVILIQRCIAIYQETKSADQQTVSEYYQKGFAAGREKAKGLNINGEPIFEQYSYKKAYGDGYRDGWDSEKIKK